jgi:D-alanyl-D-alanine carboxypeptidase
MWPNCDVSGGFPVTVAKPKARIAGGFFRILLAAGIAAWFGGAVAHADARYSSIVIDAETGAVLTEHDPDLTTYPASLTKMMTLYLVFEQLEQGKLKLDQPFVVSRHAASQAPSNLGLEPGETLALRDLILAIVTHSANDAAVVLAEGLAGSEPAFAERMTDKARALGMQNTLFHNASGLPANPQNTTTARDLVTLARALYRNFPKEYAYFSTTEFTFHGRDYANHNHLMQAFAGMDGIKTGYINASGFNLAASAVRDNHRLIGVIMGGESAHSRDMKMAALLNASFARIATGMPVQTVEDEPAGNNENTLAHSARRAIAALSPVPHAEAATIAPRPIEHPHHVKTATDGWSIQVGAYAQHAMAERAGGQTLAKLPVSFKGRSLVILGPSESAKEKVYRARIEHFTRHDAALACRALHRQHRACAVIAPDATQVASR